MTTIADILAVIEPGEKLYYQELLDRLSGPRGVVIALAGGIKRESHGELTMWYADRRYEDGEWLKTDCCIRRRGACL